jgi:hypothetical protein
VICSFQRIATAEVDDSGKPTTGGETDSGELVLSNLQGDHPVASGNLGTDKLVVLHRTNEMISFVGVPAPNGLTTPSGVLITLFLKSGVVMLTNHEMIHALDSKDAPLGFVEIGTCRGLK